MPEHLPHSTDLPRGTFAEGQSDPDRFRDDARIGRFSDGEAERLGDEEPGRFSEGLEVLDDADPEKHVEGRFSDEGR